MEKEEDYGERRGRFSTRKPPQEEDKSSYVLRLSPKKIRTAPSELEEESGAPRPFQLDVEFLPRPK